MSDAIKRTGDDHPAIAPNSVVTRMMSESEKSVEVASSAIKKTERTLSNLDSLVDRALDARAALDIMTDKWRVSWMDFIEQSEERIKTLRETRFAFDSETRLLMASLKEVRQFFLDANHDQEVARLREFVDLCERLQKLKESGFLDTVADTLIKLS